jgi:hypothetical protein
MRKPYEVARACASKAGIARTTPTYFARKLVEAAPRLTAEERAQVTGLLAALIPDHSGSRGD